MAAEKSETMVRTWSIIGAIAISFLMWGLLIYFVIKDKGPPDWDFSVVPDIPGESTYSTMNPQRPHGLAPSIEANPVEPQHVMAPETEYQMLEKQGK